MTLRSIAGAGLVLAGFAAAAHGQGDPNQVAAKVERAPLRASSADRFRVPIIVEPLRRVVVTAAHDGIVRDLPALVGSITRDNQEVARLDSNAALARVKIAMAETREIEAERDTPEGRRPGAGPVLAAKVEAARARVELAQMEVEACYMRAPFAGRVMAVYLSPGQYVARGTPLLEIADVSSLRVLLPVDRTAVKLGGEVKFTIESTPVKGRVTAVLPLAEDRAALRELAAPLASAWVVVENPSGAFEPGQRAHSPFVPDLAVATVPTPAIGRDVQGASKIQVIRADRVTDLAVTLLGQVGGDRSQVSGAFRPGDVLILSSSIPLRAGTYIRFNDPADRPLEGAPAPEGQFGDPADVRPPSGVAPIGSGSRPRPASGKPDAGAGTVPF